MTMTPDLVVSAYPPTVARAEWSAVGPADGLSGASVWSGTVAGRHIYALKCWPDWMTAEHLRQIHSRMSEARTGGCEFVPTVLLTRGADTVCTTEGRCWDVTTWMPGQQGRRGEISPDRLAAACTAIALLHRAWCTSPFRTERCSAVTRRLIVLNRWSTQRGTFDFSGSPILARSLTLVSDRVIRCRALLEPWRTVPVPSFACHGDLWGENILFTHDRVSGVIDYGAMRVDSPASDLARLLGDLAGPDSAGLDAGVATYHAANPPVHVPVELVRVLAETGIVCALANWHLRLADRPMDTLSDRVVARIDALCRSATSDHSSHGGRLSESV